MMILAGFFFALSYLFLKRGFEVSNFITGLTLSKLAGGIFALTFLAIPSIRKQIFTPNSSESAPKSNKFLNKTFILLIIGQAMGAVQGFLLTFAVSLANPALVNSLFGIQYLVILTTSLLLSKSHPNLLGERLTKAIILQKVTGSIILSIGLYLLAQ